MFTTDRLLPRVLTLSHNDVQVQRFITNEPIVPRPTKHRGHLKKQAEQSTLYFTLTLPETGEFAGKCSVTIQDSKNMDGFFGTALRPKFLGAGYWMETFKFVIGYAFKALGAHIVSLMVFEGNQAAISLYKRLSKEEGRKRRCNWVEGHWEDMIYMGILDDEWATMNVDENRLPSITTGSTSPRLKESTLWNETEARAPN